MFTDEAMLDFFVGVKVFAGLPNPNVVRMAGKSGSQFDIVFDIGEDMYQTRRQVFSSPHRPGPWAPQPKILDIQGVTTTKKQ